MLFDRKAFSHQVQIDFAALQTLQQSSQLTKEPFSTKINIFKWADALNSVPTDANNGVHVLFSLINTKQNTFDIFSGEAKGSVAWRLLHKLCIVRHFGRGTNFLTLCYICSVYTEKLSP